MVSKPWVIARWLGGCQLQKICMLFRMRNMVQCNAVIKLPIPKIISQYTSRSMPMRARCSVFVRQKPDLCSTVVGAVVYEIKRTTWKRHVYIQMNNKLHYLKLSHDYRKYCDGIVVNHNVSSKHRNQISMAVNISSLIFIIIRIWWLLLPIQYHSLFSVSRVHRYKKLIKILIKTYRQCTFKPISYQNFVLRCFIHFDNITCAYWLTHIGRDEMAAISHTIFPNAFF